MAAQIEYINVTEPSIITILLCIDLLKCYPHRRSQQWLPGVGKVFGKLTRHKVLRGKMRWVVTEYFKPGE